MKLPTFNPNSKDHLSALFFGGVLLLDSIEPIVKEDGSFEVFKTGPNKGQIKCKKVKKEVKIEGIGLKPLPHWGTKKEGVFQTNKAVLQLISGENNEE